MKSILLLLPLFLLYSCVETQYPGPVAKPTPTEPTAPTTPVIPTSPEVEPTPVAPVVPAGNEFSSYITNFEIRHIMAGGSANPSNLQVVFADDLPTNVLGTCTMNAAYVKISRSWWNQLSAAHREELIFHELGHCVLGRLHDNTMVSGFPRSLMNSYHMGPGIYLRVGAAYQNYMSELFGASSQTFAALTYNENNYASKTFSNASIYMPTETHESDDHSLEGMDEITCDHQ